MFQIIALAGTVALLLVLLPLRQILSLSFPLLRVAVSETGAPESSKDLFYIADKELTALGFEQPIWLSRQLDPDAPGFAKNLVAYRNYKDGTVVWLNEPTNIEMPNRLNVCWSTKLLDGRVVCSQAFDASVKCMATAELMAQTIDGHSLAVQWQQHERFRSKFECDFDPNSLTDDAIVREDGEAQNERTKNLYRDGRLWQDAKGIFRPDLAFAIRILWLMWRQPRPKDNKNAEVPLQRLVSLAEQLFLIQRREPEFKAQLMLFIVSVALFIILGGVIWGTEIALMILVAVIFHELGHYLAMRVFGFSNVQMLALPLVGGVTIGYNDKPTANGNAWMSLMGPMPGIILGWGILIYMYGFSDLSDYSEYVLEQNWLTTFACILLLINYLNVLPIPPLDGSHVVQALLPPKRFGVQGVVIIIFSLIGIVATLVTGFYLLTVLIVYQLFLVRSYFETGLAIKRLVKEDPRFPTTDRRLSMTRVLEVLGSVGGTKYNPVKRVTQAEQVLQALSTKTMSLPQRSAVSAVYCALMVFPMLAIIGGILLYFDPLAQERLQSYLDQDISEQVRFEENNRELMYLDPSKENSGLNNNIMFVEDNGVSANPHSGIGMTN